MIDLTFTMVTIDSHGLLLKKHTSISVNGMHLCNNSYFAILIEPHFSHNYYDT